MFTLMTILSLCLDSTLTLCSPAIEDSRTQLFRSRQRRFFSCRDEYPKFQVRKIHITKMTSTIMEVI